MGSYQKFIERSPDQGTKDSLMSSLCILKVPKFKQRKDWDCGAACAYALLKGSGKPWVRKYESMFKYSHTGRDGTSPLHLRWFLASQGIKATSKCGTPYSRLLNYAVGGKPSVVVLQAYPEDNPDYLSDDCDCEAHYAIYIGGDLETAVFMDPALGAYAKLSVDEFKRRWSMFHRPKLFIQKVARWLGFAYDSYAITIHNQQYKTVTAPKRLKRID